MAGRVISISLPPFFSWYFFLLRASGPKDSTCWLQHSICPGLSATSSCWDAARQESAPNAKPGFMLYWLPQPSCLSFPCCPITRRPNPPQETLPANKKFPGMSNHGYIRCPASESYYHPLRKHILVMCCSERS